MWRSSTNNLSHINCNPFMSHIRFHFKIAFLVVSLLPQKSSNTDLDIRKQVHFKGRRGSYRFVDISLKLPDSQLLQDKSDCEELCSGLWDGTLTEEQRSSAWWRPEPGWAGHYKYDICQRARCRTLTNIFGLIIFFNVQQLFWVDSIFQNAHALQDALPASNPLLPTRPSPTSCRGARGEQHEWSIAVPGVWVIIFVWTQCCGTHFNVDFQFFTRCQFWKTMCGWRERRRKILVWKTHQHQIWCL